MSVERIPDRVGRYRVLSLLGRGTSGVVFSAFDDELQRQVALKVMLADSTEAAGVRTRFYREARAAGQLAHRNVVTVYDIGEADGQVYLVLELLHGVTLARWLEQEPTPCFEERLEVLLQAVNGVAAAHHAGIVHRDLKPANLFVQRHGVLKVVDFGVARLMSSSVTANGTVIGTPDFMSPEQTRGEEADHRSDIFALGAVCYLAVTGRKPFVAPDLSAVLYRVNHETPPPISTVEAPAAFIKIVERCLEKKASRRYQTTDDLLADLTRVQSAVSKRCAETVGHVRDRCALLVETLTRRQAGGQRLGLGFPDPLQDPLVTALIDRLPLVGEVMASPSALPPTRTGHVVGEQTLAAVNLAVEEAARDLAAVELANQQLAEAESLATTSPEQGLRAAEQAHRLFPTSPIVAKALDRGRRELASRRAVETEADRLIAEARSALSDGHATTARRLCAEAKTLAPWLGRITTSADRIAAELERASAERDRRLRQLTARVEAGLSAGLLTDAENALRQAIVLAPDDQTVAALDGRLRAAVATEAARSEERREAAAAIHAARTRIERGDTTSALADLRQFLEQHPGAADVGAEVNRIVEAVESAAARAHAQAHAVRLIASAERALADGDLARASAEASAAAAADHTNGAARDLQRRVETRRREELEQRARDEKLTKLLADGQRALDGGKFEKAARYAHEAAATSPLAAGPAGLLDRIALAQREAAQAERQARVTAQRRAAAEPALHVARSAARAGDWRRASWAAENALAQDPGSPEAQQLLARAREQAASGTVGSANDGWGHSSDETVTMPVPSVWARATVFVQECSRALRARLASGRLRVR